MIRGTLLCAHMGCRSNYRRICERPASTLQLMAGSRKKPVQLPVVQLLERVGKFSRQHVSRWQFFGAAHDRSGLLGGCQACRSVSATRLLSACRLEQIRRLLLRATQWHAANYAASDKMQQVGHPLARHILLATASGHSGINSDLNAHTLAAAVIVEA